MRLGAWQVPHNKDSARARVSAIAHAILRPIIEVALCRITKLHNAQASCACRRAASQPASTRFTGMFRQIPSYEMQPTAPRTEVTSQRPPHHEMMSTLAREPAREPARELGNVTRRFTFNTD